MPPTNEQTVLGETERSAPTAEPSSSVPGIEEKPARSESSDVFDDIWEEPPSHGTTPWKIPGRAESSRSTATPDLNRLRTTHVTAGYREGVAAAREGAVQGGFDEGYLLGAAIGIRAGYLQGVIEGLENGLDLGALDAAARKDIEEQLQQAKQELQLSSLLGEQWIGANGTWKWTVEPMHGEQEPTIETVADEHPVLQRWNRISSIYAHKLGLHRRESN